MSRSACLLALAAGLVPAGACAATPLSFEGAPLGMSLAEWRSLAPPQGAGPDVLPACSDDPRVSTIAHNPLGAMRGTSDVVTCAYVDRVGQTALPRSVHVDAAYSADDLRYRFDHGRLAEIRFKASIDAFSYVMSMLELQYGPPTATIRDEVRTPDGHFARVRQMWRTADGEITVVDPSDPPTQLEVSLSSRGSDAAAQPTALSARGRGR